MPCWICSGAIKMMKLSEIIAWRARLELEKHEGFILSKRGQKVLERMADQELAVVVDALEGLIRYAQLEGEPCLATSVLERLKGG